MTDAPGGDRLESIQKLLELARESSKASRRVLYDNITDLFLAEEGRLSERERVLTGDILAKLVRAMELEVRKELAQRLAPLAGVPHDLVVLLANDEIQVAEPLLRHSNLLQDPDLIEIVRQRGQEHLLAVALRAPLSAEVGDAIVDHGDELAIEALIKNSDAALSRRALEYVVAEAERVDRFQEPLVRRHDLPPDLGCRLFWWVSGALRQAILGRYETDPDALDDAIDGATRTVLDRRSSPASGREATLLAQGVADARVLNERFLVQALRGGRVSAFVAGLAQLCRVEVAVARRIVFDRAGESLAIAVRAVGIDRSSFATIFLLTRQGSPTGARPTGVQGAHAPTDPSVIRAMMAFFDKLDPDQARKVLRYWRADRAYIAAIEAIEPPSSAANAPS